LPQPIAAQISTNIPQFTGPIKPGNRQFPLFAFTGCRTNPAITSLFEAENKFSNF